MKINELENLLGITRANIRFYEKEGLLNPARNENGYREYSEEDVSTLKKIIIFRKLGMSLPEIKNILDGSLDISDAIEQNIENLHQQIAELNGALEVSKIIKTDALANESFDEDRYWNLIQTKEENGEKFMELVKDYMELEKKSFLSMWSNAFFLDINKEVKQYGWKIVLVILLAVCVIRGIVQELFWVGGSFLEGFAYPFFLFGVMSIIIIPIFFLHRKYKNCEPEEVKLSKHPRLITALKWIGGFAYFIGYLLIIPSIGEKLFTLGQENVSYVATFDFFFLYWIMGMGFLSILVYFYSKYGIFPNRINGEVGIKSNVPRKVKRRVTFLSAVALIISFFLSMMWYDCFTEDGLTVRRFAYSKTYTWEETDYYTLSANPDGTLAYSVIMQDGTKADCMGSMVGMYNLPEEKYPDSDYDFVRYLSKKFTEQGVELKVNNWEKLYKDLDYESWDELAQDIQKIAGQ